MVYSGIAPRTEALVIVRSSVEPVSVASELFIAVIPFNSWHSHHNNFLCLAKVLRFPREPRNSLKFCLIEHAAEPWVVVPGSYGRISLF